MILDGPKHSHSFFLRETGGPGEKPSYLSPSDHQFSDVFFFQSFLFFLFFPLIFFIRLFPFSYFLYVLLPHISSKMPMLQFKTVNISNTILHRHFVFFFRFRHRHFLFSTIRYVRHVLFFELSAPLSFAFLSRSQNTYCLMVCISEYVSEDKLFMRRI